MFPGRARDRALARSVPADDAEPGAEGLGRELEVDEARAGDLDLHEGLVEFTGGLQRVDQGGREGSRVGLGLLRLGDGAVGLEVRVAGIGGAQFRLERRIKAGDGRGYLPEQGIEFSGRIEPDGHASSRKPRRPLGKRKRRQGRFGPYFRVMR